MDPVFSNFVINVLGISVGASVAIIAAFSACMQKSRCTSIHSPCISCERTVLEDPIPTPSSSFSEEESPIQTRMNGSRI